MRFMVGLIPHSDFLKLQSSDDYARNDPEYSHDISQSHTKLLMIKNTYHHWLFNRVFVVTGERDRDGCAVGEVHLHAIKDVIHIKSESL